MMPRRRSDPGFGSGRSRFPGTFQLAFQEAADGISWHVHRWLGTIVVCWDADGKTHFIDAEELFDRVRPGPRGTWPLLLGRYLRALVAVVDLPPLTGTLDDNAEQLVVHVGPRLAAPSIDFSRWSIPLVDTGLSLYLSAVHDGEFRYVTGQHVADSDHSGEFWLERALANLRERTPADWLRDANDVDGIRVNIGVESNQVSHVAARCVLLDRLLPEQQPFGSFVALPAQDELLILPVTLPAVGNLHVLKAMVDGRYRTTPWPLTDEIYWVRDGVWRRFGVLHRDDLVNIHPPDEFVEVFNLLTAAQAAKQPAGPERERTDQEAEPR